MSEEFSFEDMLEMVKSGINEAGTKPNNLNYVPHVKQLPFHHSEKKGRQYVGGNRSGKTTGGVNEDIWWLTQTHPFMKTPPPPVRGRLTTVDFVNGWAKIIRPVVKQWLPVSQLINGSWEDSWDSKEKTLRLENKSELEIMSYDQELDKFAGVPRDFIHFDEEPPKDIFGECQARLVDRNGRWWLTMTPVDGMTWTYDEIFEPSHKGNNPLIDVVVVHMLDNPHLEPEAIAEFIAGLDDEEKIIRGTGNYIPIGGLIFKFFHESEHVIPTEGKTIVPSKPSDWDFYTSLDHGFANPTAILFHAVNKIDGTIVTFDEHYKSEMTVDQHADWYLERLAFYRDNYGIVPKNQIADPAIRQRNAVTGLSIQIEYSQRGVYWALNQTKDVKAGLDKMNNYFRQKKWYITDNCVNFIKELKTYKRKTYMTSKLKERNNQHEEPQKKNDHACDSARYFFSFMPDLGPVNTAEAPGDRSLYVARLLSPGTTFNPRITNIDRNVLNMSNRNYVIDEYVGEY